jgi:hypothetical protein
MKNWLENNLVKHVFFLNFVDDSKTKKSQLQFRGWLFYFIQTELLRGFALLEEIHRLFLLRDGIFGDNAFGNIRS